MHFFTVQEKALTADLILAAIEKVMSLFSQPEVPVLILPKRTADNLGIDYEKIYNLWIFNTEDLDPYFRFLKRLIKFIE